MVLHEKVIAGLTMRPSPDGINRAGQEVSFDARRRRMVEERTGQIVVSAPNIGFVALGDLYLDKTKRAMSYDSQNTEPADGINPDQLALSTIN